MTWVVTGASGFLASHLLLRLANQDVRVIAATRNPSRVHVRAANIEVVRADFSEPQFFRNVPQDATVCHLASVRNQPGGRVAEMRRVNVEATEEFARRAVEACVRRFLYVSTVMVFGPGEKPRTIDAPILPASGEAYSMTRAEGLEKLEMMVPQGLPLVTVIPSIIAGPDRDAGPNRIARYVRNVASSRFRVGIGRRSPRRNVVYVGDVVESLVWAAAHGVVGERYAVTGENVSMQEIEEKILSMVQRRSVRIVVPEAVAVRVGRLLDRLTRSDREIGYERRIRTLLDSWCFIPLAGPPGLERTPIDTTIRMTLQGENVNP